MCTTEVNGMTPVQKSLLKRGDRYRFGLKIGEGTTRKSDKDAKVSAVDPASAPRPRNAPVRSVPSAVVPYSACTSATVQPARRRP